MDHERTNERTIVAFLATNDAEAAAAFYRDVLGMTLVEDTPFAVVFVEGGTTLRIQKTRDHVPAPHTALGFQVRDLAAYVRALSGRGVAFVRYPHFEQDELGIWTAPGSGAKVAWFKDPDGNLLSLSE